MAVGGQGVMDQMYSMMGGGRACMDLSEPFNEDNCGILVPDLVRHVLREEEVFAKEREGVPAMQPCIVYKKFASFVIYMVTEANEESPLFCLDMLTIFLKAFTVVAQARAEASATASGFFTPLEALAASFVPEKLFSNPPPDSNPPPYSNSPSDSRLRGSALLDLVEHLPALQHVCDYMFTGGCVVTTSLEEITGDLKTIFSNTQRRSPATAAFQALF
ncbi:hypothetical protein GNI_135710 [Gregarina niphandrodes]|uniref:Uncharacterized protein n=1 Tax=Gregarina niphandrodes TaxID=110365 RepID=A0A023B150_GRENI|nr:hypothetical protein GNI_135710 [Gregarina niphandrodes]EZG46019.1 hypothetical protein GNI_135710 [Gregarina niphandrodes]|eukprot:XP_011132393.1 hypothetical protein GNI_135710 [Gregarina niphandrodes]